MEFKGNCYDDQDVIVVVNCFLLLYCNSLFSKKNYMFINFYVFF